MRNKTKLWLDKLNLLLLLGFQVIASQEITAQITGLIWRSTVAVQLIAAVLNRQSVSCVQLFSFSNFFWVWIREAVDLIYLQQYPSTVVGSDQNHDDNFPHGGRWPHVNIVTSCWLRVTPTENYNWNLDSIFLSTVFQRNARVKSYLKYFFLDEMFMSDSHNQGAEESGYGGMGSSFSDKAIRLNFIRKVSGGCKLQIRRFHNLPIIYVFCRCTLSSPYNLSSPWPSLGSSSSHQWKDSPRHTLEFSTLPWPSPSSWCLPSFAWNPSEGKLLTTWSSWDSSLCVRAGW